MASINNVNVDIDIESCITFLKVSNDAFCDSGECNFKPTRGRTKTLSPVTNIHQTIIQMESKVGDFLFSDPPPLSGKMFDLINRGSLSSVGPVIRLAGGSPTLMKLPPVWPTITTFSLARKVKIKMIHLSPSRSSYSVSEPGLAGGEPYNTTMQCYCGQNSCPLCNLLLNLQITNTGID